MSDSKPKILITGATGQVGGGVVKILRADPSVSPVAAVRNPAKAKKLGIPFVELDLDRYETFAPALKGIDRLFLMTGYTVDMLRQTKVLVDAAKKAGVRHIVHLGACGGDDATVGHWVWHQLLERYIEWAGFSFAHIRPEQFMQNLLGYSGNPNIVNGAILQYFAGSSLSWVDCEDVAALSAVCLRDADKHNGQVYRMGYDAKTLYEVAEILTEVIGKPYSYDPRPPEEFLAKVLAAGADPAYMKCVYDHYFAYADGKIPEPDRVFDNFEPVVGRKPVMWVDFARKHADLLRSFA